MLERMMSVLSSYFLICFMIAFSLSAINAQAQNPISSSYDCSDIQVDYENDPTLTEDEKIALMDQAFFESLNQYDACQSAASTMSGGGASGGGNGGGGEGSAAGMQGGGESIASSSMSGTEAPKPVMPAHDISESDAEEGNIEGNESADENLPPIQQAGTGGAVPADLPSADNDDALASQIRYAATQETDPVKKAQLWNEYRKYKGLPAK